MNITFENFVRTRHAMWLEKTYGVPIDHYLDHDCLMTYELMRNYRFTNVWRELDRGTLEMLDLQQKYLDISTLEVAVFHTLLYRFFNSMNGYIRYIKAATEYGVLITHPTEEMINSVLDQKNNFSGAYIRTIKRSTAIKALQNLWSYAEHIASEIEEYVHAVNGESRFTVGQARDLVRSAFGAVPSFGDFLADQLMLDFCWQGNPWGLTFEPALGPGAKRGMIRAGLTFDAAIDAGVSALKDMPIPYVKNENGWPNYPVKFGAVEAEHQLCEAEKLWKILDAVAENEGRQVKMRKYASTTKLPLSQPMPKNWGGPLNQYFKAV